MSAADRQRRAAALLDPLLASLRSLPLPRATTLRVLLPSLTQLHDASPPVALRRALLRVVHAVLAPVEVFAAPAPLASLPEALPTLLPKWLADLVVAVRRIGAGVLCVVLCRESVLCAEAYDCVFDRTADRLNQDESSLPLLVQSLQAVPGLLPALLAEFARRMRTASVELVTQFCRVLLLLCRAEEMRGLLRQERQAVVAFRSALEVRIL